MCCIREKNLEERTDERRGGDGELLFGSVKKTKQKKMIFLVFTVCCSFDFVFFVIIYFKIDCSKFG